MARLQMEAPPPSPTQGGTCGGGQNSLLAPWQPEDPLQAPDPWWGLLSVSQLVGWDLLLSFLSANYSHHISRHTLDLCSVPTQDSPSSSGLDVLNLSRMRHSLLSRGSLIINHITQSPDEERNSPKIVLVKTVRWSSIYTCGQGYGNRCG